MKRALFLFIVLLISACSTTAIDPTRTLNTDNYREIAGVVHSCTDLILGILNVAPNNKIKQTEVASFDEFSELVGQNDVGSIVLSQGDIRSFKKKNLFIELGIEKKLELPLQKYLGKKISEIPFQKILEDILGEEIGKLEGYTSLEEVIKDFVKLKIPESLINEILTHSFVVKSKISEVLEVQEAMRLREFLVSQLSRTAQEAEIDTQLLTLVEFLKKAQLPEEDIQVILKESPLFKKMAAINPELAKTLVKSFHENIQLSSGYIFENVSMVFQIINLDSKEFRKILSKINSGYGFYKALERIIKTEGSSTRFLKELSNSPFCKRVHIGIEDLKKVAQIKDKTILESLEDVFPLYKNGKKTFLTADYYDRELEVIEVKNQCGWGSCWAHSAIEKMETEMFYIHGEEIPISVDYSYMNYILNEFKKSLTQFQKVEEGNFSENFKYFSNKWGIIPRSAWQPKYTFHNSNNALIVKRELEEIRVRFANSYQYHRDFEKRKIELQKSMEAMDAVMEKYFGIPPKRFFFKNKKYTPHSFKEEFYPQLNSPIARMVLKESKEKYRGGILGKPLYTDSKDSGSGDLYALPVYEVSFEQMAKTITTSIDQKRPVRLTIDWPKDGSTYKGINNEGRRVDIPFVNQKTGQLTAPKEKFELKEPGGHHAVLIVGYELDTEGKLVTLKILNSWGEGSGDQGFYHMDANFLSAFGVRILFNPDDGLAFYKLNNSHSPVKFSIFSPHLKTFSYISTN